MSLRLVLLFLLTLAPVARAQQGIPSALIGVHRIVFLGDSITQAGDYVTDIDAWLVSKGIDIEVLNLGLASETASDLTEPENAGHLKSFGFGRPFVSLRLDRALAATRPDVVVACYGMNDGSSLPADETGTQRFGAAITRVRAAALAAGAKRVVLVTPPVHDAKGDASQAAHDANLTRYSEWLLARTGDGWDVVDVHGPMRQALDVARASNPGFAFARDGVHPGAEGHWLMASAILTQWLGANLEGISSPSQLFAASGAELVDLVSRRMKTRSAAWMASIGHSRPGVPGGPGTAPGPSLEEAAAQAAAITGEIARTRRDDPRR